MKSVIMIAYSFPPEGHAGVYRPLRFIRYLPALGWRPTVISLKTDVYDRYDPELLSLVPPETAVIRVPNPDPWKALQEWRGRRIQQKLSEAPRDEIQKIHMAHHASFRSSIREMVRIMEAWCYHPDGEMGWIRPAVREIVKVCAQNRPEVIWATGGPWSSFIVARRASALTGVPYVLDFRDAWTLVPEPFATKRPIWATRSDRRTLYGLLTGAQAVIFRYKTETECYWRAYPGALDAERIHIIPNGFDGAVEPCKEIPGDKCKILYSGTLAYYRYDTLLDALARLKQIDPEWPHNFPSSLSESNPRTFFPRPPTGILRT